MAQKLYKRNLGYISAPGKVLPGAVFFKDLNLP